MDTKSIACFVGGAVVGAAALAALRRRLQPRGFPSLVDELLKQQDLGHFPQELSYLLRHKAELKNVATAEIPRPVGNVYDREPGKTEVVRIALTGGPCAGKSSALSSVREHGKKMGFDVYVAPETATLIFASGFQFPASPSSELMFTFQLALQKLQLALERSLTKVAAETGRPSIIIFDRGLLDCKGYNSEENWQKILEGFGGGDSAKHRRGVTEHYLLARYDAVLHLVTAADGAQEFYKQGWTEDDSGNKVFRRESPQEAIELDKLMLKAWAYHPKRFFFPNTREGAKIEIKEKLESVCAAVMEVASARHPPSAKAS